MGWAEWAGGRRAWLLLAVLPASLIAATPASAVAAVTWSAPQTADPPGNPPGFTDLFCFPQSDRIPTCVGTDAQGRVDSSRYATSGPASWSEAAVTPDEMTHVSCALAAAIPCVGTDGNGDVISSTDPSGGAGAWTTTSIDPGHALEAISCIDVSGSNALCVAVDDRGDAFSSTNPSGGAGAWSGPVSIDPQPPGGGVDGISCASMSLCVAVDTQGGVVSSTDPTAGSGAWHRVDPDGSEPIRDVSCPTTSLCVAVGGSGSGQVLTSTDPSGDATAWQVQPLDGSNQLNAVSCGSAPLCGAVDDHGNALVTTDPAGGAGSWSSPEDVDPGSDLVTISCLYQDSCLAGDTSGRIAEGLAEGPSSWGVVSALGGPYSLEQMSCPSPSLCVAIDDGDREVSSTDPVAGSAWSVSPLSYAWPASNGFPLSCADSTLCVALPYAWSPPALAGDSILLASSDPTAGGATWSGSTFNVLGPEYDSVSCASNTLCAIAGNGIMTSTQPTDPSSWAGADTGSADAIYVSCVTGPLCVGAGGDEVVASEDPTGTAAWTDTQVDTPGADLRTVWCSSRSFCAAADDTGNVVTSTNPTGGFSDWTLHALSLGYPLTDLRCPSASLCVALGQQGQVVSSTNPASPDSSWTATTIEPGVQLTSLSCPSPELCIAGDADGNVIVGTAPAPPPTAGSQPTPRAPVLAKRFTLTPVSGKVLVRALGAKSYRRVTTATSFAFGATVDTAGGRVRITVAKRGKGTKMAQLWGGILRLSQSRAGTVTATLAAQLPGCHRATPHKTKTRHLWVTAPSGIRTIGRYAGATPTGPSATWLTQDSCTTTLLHARTRTITVLGLPHNQRLRVPARHSYVARPK